ncbi:MAG: hypothetical protein ABIH00_07970 [Armatimonadota bacterium]
MKKLLIALVAIAFLTAVAFAASTDTQTIYYEIDAINEIAFGADVTLTIDHGGAGTGPAGDSTGVQDYYLTTNGTAKKNNCGN